MHKHFWQIPTLIAILAVAGCGGESQAPSNADDARQAAGAAAEQAEQAMEDTAAATEETAAEAVEGAADAAEAATDAATQAAEDIAGSSAPGDRPEGVTAAMVEEGRAVYAGAGLCTTCHAPDGSGVPNLGSNLVDDEWLHSDGSYEGIVATVTNGVPAAQSSTGVPMIARGGSSISDAQVRAVSAYVWTLSR
jgi:cytochrome c5